MNTTMMCKVEQTRNKKEQVKKNIQKAFSPDKHADDEWGGPHFGEGVKFLSQLLHWVRQQLVMVTVIVGGTVVFTVAGMKGVDCPFSATVAEMEKDWHSAKGVGSFEDYMRQQLPSENVAQGLTLVFTDPTNRLFHCEAPWDFLDGLYFTMTTSKACSARPSRARVRTWCRAAARLGLCCAARAALLFFFHVLLCSCLCGCPFRHLHVARARACRFRHRCHLLRPAAAHSLLLMCAHRLSAARPHAQSPPLGMAI